VAQDALQKKKPADKAGFIVIRRVSNQWHLGDST
jgi:hypothetical protein